MTTTVDVEQRLERRFLLYCSCGNVLMSTEKIQLRAVAHAVFASRSKPAVVCTACGKTLNIERIRKRREWRQVLPILPCCLGGGGNNVGPVSSTLSGEEDFIFTAPARCRRRTGAFRKQVSTIMQRDI